MQIGLLEESIGPELFEKIGKSIQLTEAGRELYRYSQSINSQLREAEAVMESLKVLGLTRHETAVSS